MGLRLFCLLAFCFSTFAFAEIDLKFSGRRCQQGSRDASLREAAAGSCQCIDRALNALTNHREKVRETFKNGINFGVFFKNPNFYLQHLGNRQRACHGGSVKFECVGLCRTANERLAYVNVWFGFVGSTIHVCDEMFDKPQSTRLDTILHEFGRLENIGDSPNFDTNNIYVWDQIVGRLCEDETYRSIVGG